MKRLIISLLLGSILYSCQRNPEEAHEVIAFHNKVLSLYKTYNDTYIDEVRKYIDRVDDFLQKKTTGQVATPPTHPIFFFVGTNEEDLKTPKGFGEKQEAISSSFKTMKESVKDIRTLSDKLTKYIDAEVYKYDNSKRLVALKQAISDKTIIFYQSRDKLFGIMNPIVAKAEDRLLAQHPLKENIILSKQLLALIDAFVTEVAVATQKEILNEDRLQAHYNAIENQLAKNKSTPIKKEVSAEKRINFDNFNQEVSSFLGVSRKLLRNIKESKSIEKEDYTNLNNKYETVIRAYNHFVK